jgi:hypothetical protein
MLGMINSLKLRFFEQSHPVPQGKKREMDDHPKEAKQIPPSTRVGNRFSQELSIFFRKRNF